MFRKSVKDIVSSLPKIRQQLNEAITEQQKIQEVASFKIDIQERVIEEATVERKEAEAWLKVLPSVN